MEDINQLIDPDEPVQDQYRLDEDIQKHILSMLLTDHSFLIQSMELVKPYYFTNEIHQDISRILFKYFNKYSHNPPKVYIEQEIDEVLDGRDNATKLRYKSELDCLCKYYIPGINERDYLLDKITNFAKAQALKRAFNDSLELIKRNYYSEETWFKIHELLNGAMSVDRKFDPGLNYFESVEDRYKRMEEAKEKGEVFSTGFLSINNALGGGSLRGEMYSFLGLSGSGKSRNLVSAAIENLKCGKKVLYVSLEMSQDEVAKRFDAGLVSELTGPNNLLDVNINNLIDNQSVVVKTLHNHAKEYGDCCRIKQFPAGMMDVSAFKAYFIQLVLNNFRPDLVILDYIGEMKDYPGLQLWDSKYRIVRDLRAFAVEQQFCLFTAMQSNKSGRDALKDVDGVLEDSALGDSFGQAKPLDGLYTINQNTAEQAANIGRIFVAKHRHGISKFYVHVEYDPKTLMIKEISENQYLERFKEARGKLDVKKTSAMMDSDLANLKNKPKPRFKDEDEDVQ